MTHLAFARKYRPRTFSEVVGQEAIASALQGAVKGERTASVCLFSGSHGVGKTSMARILAKALNCPQSRDGDPCLECSTCLSIDRGEAMDVIEIDAASNRSINDARQIRQNVRYKAQGMRFKVYILDEAHQLTKEAFDALLKTFEEAPAHVRLILATTELQKIPSTIRSRSQVFHFRRSSRADLERRLGQILELEGRGLGPEALSLIVRRARGSMRDAQKMLDQVLSLGGEAEAIDAAKAAVLLGAFTPERIQALLAALARGDAAALLAEVSAHFADGGQAGTFLEELQDALRAVLYLKTCGPDSELVRDTSYAPDHLAPTAEALGEEGILYALQLLAEVEQKIRIARPREPRILIEVALVRLARARELRPMGEVLARLERLEQALGGGGSQPPSSPPTRGGGGGQRRAGPGRGPRTGGAPPRGTGGDRAGPRAQSAPPARGQVGSRQRVSYSYPAEMGPGQGGSPRPEVTPGRTLAEAERSARLDGAGSQSPAAGATDSAGHQTTAAEAVDGVAVMRAWQELRKSLADKDNLGMAADVIERGRPKVSLDSKGTIRITLALKPMWWDQINIKKNVERLGRLFSQRLGASTPLTLERIEPQAESPQATNHSVYDEEVVKIAQKELDARRM